MELALTLPSVGWASWLTPFALFWESLGLFLVPVVLVVVSLPLRSPGRRAQAGPALLSVGLGSGLVGGAFALCSLVLWPNAWPDQYGAYLAELGGFFLLSADLVVLTSVVALTEASWARGWLVLLRGVLGLIGVGSLATLLLRALTCSSCAPDQTLWGTLLAVYATLWVLLFYAALLLLTVSVFFGPLIVVGALIALVRSSTLRAILLREGGMGTLGAALVVGLLLVRGPGDWKEAPFGLDVLLASVVVSTALFLLEYRRTRQHTPSAGPPEAQHPSWSRAVLSFRTPPSVPPEPDLLHHPTASDAA